MKYLEWNNLIGQYLFNKDKIQQTVFIAISRSEIEKIGLNTQQFQNAMLAWDDFCRAIRVGTPNSIQAKSYLDKLNDAFEFDKKRQKNTFIDGISLDFPTYLTYLVTPLLPFSENDSFQINAFYPPFEAFCKENKLPILNVMNESHNWNAAWFALLDWSWLEKYGELGLFDIPKLTSSNYVYAGKAFSQCLFLPRGFERLSDFFFQQALLPEDTPSVSEWLEMLQRGWVTVLQQRQGLLPYLNNENDISRAIVGIVTQAYKKWDAAFFNDNPKILNKRNSVEKCSNSPALENNISQGTRARLFVSFRENRKNDSLEWGFRLFSNIDFPEDLTFENKLCTPHRNGWSSHLAWGFDNQKSVRDDFNRWQASVAKRDFRLFVNGASSPAELHSDYWIETNDLNPFLPMRLLFPKNMLKEMTAWLYQTTSSTNGYKKFEDLTNDFGLPSGWYLFEFEKPSVPLRNCKVSSERQIDIVGGLSLGGRTFLAGALPEITVKNAMGTEQLFLRFTNSRPPRYLRKKEKNELRWVLPSDLPENEPFFIEIEGGSDKTLNIRIERAGESSLNNFIPPPYRNTFGELSSEISDFQGNNCTTVNKKQLAYEPLFKVRKSDGTIQRTHFLMNYNDRNDRLIEWLLLRKKVSFEDFNKAFDALFWEENDNSTKDNTSFLKSQSLDWYERLGFVNVNYQDRTIIALPPQIILLPSKTEQCALLVGVRSRAFIEYMRGEAINFNIQICLNAPTEATKKWLIPTLIELKVCDTTKIGQNVISEFAKRLGISFEKEKIIQWAFAHGCEKLKNYQNRILEYPQPDDFEGYDCPCRIFDPEKLCFRKDTEGVFNSGLALIEYELRPYDRRYFLWLNGLAFQVDQTWGRWWLLQKLGKNVLFRDDNNCLAVPKYLPFPHLIEKAIQLLSSEMPKEKRMQGIDYFIYKNVDNLLSYNILSECLGQKINELPKGELLYKPIESLNIAQSSKIYLRQTR